MKVTKEEATKKYLDYLEGHIGNVVEALELFIDSGIPYVVENADRLRDIVKEHDKSKYEEPEWTGYLHHFYPTSEEDSLKIEEFDEATRHHVENNKHHWNYWVKDNELVDDIDEEEYKLYCVERCADWCAMSIQNDNDVLDWYNANKASIKMPEYGYSLCEEILKAIPKDYDLSYHGTRAEGKPEREAMKESEYVDRYKVEDIERGSYEGYTYYSLIAYNENNSVGRLDYYKVDNEYHIENLIVYDEYKRQGVGTYLCIVLQKKVGDQDVYFDLIVPDSLEYWKTVADIEEYKQGAFGVPYYKGRIKREVMLREHLLGLNREYIKKLGKRAKIGNNGTAVSIKPTFSSTFDEVIEKFKEEDERRLDESMLLEVRASQMMNKTKSEDPARVERSRRVSTKYIGMSKFGVLNFKTTSETRPGGYHYQTVEFQSLKPFETIIKQGKEIMPNDIKKELADQDLNVFCTCFVGDTKVLMSDGSYKKIEEVEIGDKVISHTGEEREVTSQMINHFAGSLIIINGVRSTPNHPYLVLDKDTVCWKEAKDITIDMKLLKPAKKYGYIYMTTNLLNGRRYIGQHHSDKLDKNYFGSGSVISKAVKKYGKDSFKVDLLEWCYSKEDLDKKEQYYISEYMANIDRNFYNIAKGGNSFNCSGYKIIHKGDIHHFVHPDSLQIWYDLGYELGESEARCSAKSEISKRFLNSPDFLAKRELINKKIREHSRKPHKKGHHLSDEHKAKISRYQKGRPKSEETRRKMSESASRWQRGRTLPEETRIKISITSSERAKNRKRDSYGRFSKEVKDDRV